MQQHEHLSEEDREAIIESIKKGVEKIHLVSVMGAVADYRRLRQEINPAFSFPIDNSLVESISKDVVSDPVYQRIPKEKDYHISYRDVSDLERIQLETLHLQIRDLVDKVVDYYETKARAKRAEWIALFMGLVALAALIIAIKK